MFLEQNKMTVCCWGYQKLIIEVNKKLAEKNLFLRLSKKRGMSSCFYALLLFSFSVFLIGWFK